MSARGNSGRMASISFCSISADAGCASSQSARSMWVEKCSETKRTFRVVGRGAVGHQHAFDPAFPRQRGFQRRAGVVLADQPDEDAARAERGDVARDVAGAADIGLAALDRDHRRGRFRRNPRHLAIDEFVEHEIADAEHRLAGHRMRQGFKIEHLVPLSVAPSAEAVGAIEKTLDVGRDRVFQRR